MRFNRKRMVRGKRFYTADAKGGWDFLFHLTNIFGGFADFYEAGIDAFGGDNLLGWF